MILKLILTSLSIGLLLLFSLANSKVLKHAQSTTSQQVYVIAGNFSLDGELYNIAQFDVATGTWNKKYRAEISSMESTGVILDVVLNTSSNAAINQLVVVGTFDTITRTSQVEFCSVGIWNGFSFEKVGEGLCPRGNTIMTKIEAVIFGNRGDLFVGGNFEARYYFLVTQFIHDLNLFILESGMV